MNEAEAQRLWKLAIELSRENDEEKLRKYIAEIRAKGEDYKALCWLFDGYEHVKKHAPIKVLRLTRRVLSGTTNRFLLALAYSHRAWALERMGDAIGARYFATRSAELCRDNPEKYKEALIVLAFYHIFEGKFAQAQTMLEGLEGLTGISFYKAQEANMLLSLFTGDFRKLVTLVSNTNPSIKNSYSALEMLGAAREALGDLQGALKDYKTSLQKCVEAQSAYAVFPLNKIYRLKLVNSVNVQIPRKLENVARKMALHGGLEGQAGLTELNSYVLWEDQRKEEALTKLLEAGELYERVQQNLEAFIIYLMSVWLSKKTRSALFWRALEYLKPKIIIYRNFALNHFLWQDFVRSTILPLSETEIPDPEVRIRLFGKLEFQGIKQPKRWRYKKALFLFKYLLLNHGNALSGEYLAYLLWPRANPRRAAERLYAAVGAARRELGALGKLLVCESKTYVFQRDPRIWVDTTYFNHFLREAELFSKNPNLQLEKYLKALELYQDKLLPEDRYDKYIDEHRDYFHRNFQRALGKAIDLLVELGKEKEAVNLAEKFHLKFAKDEFVAKAYIDLLVKTGRIHEAEMVYKEFKRRLWREHRMKPFFKIE